MGEKMLLNSSSSEHHRLAPAALAAVQGEGTKFKNPPPKG